MNNKVLNTLEFNKIKLRLKDCAVSAPAGRMCDNLRPSSNPEWIAKAQNETEAALNRLLKDDRISFGANFDTRELMKAAEIGKVMSPGELNSLGRLLMLVDSLTEYDQKYVHSSGTEDYEDAVSSYFAGLIPVPKLLSEISRCIMPDDTIANDASAELKNIRNSFSVYSGRIHSQLNQMVTGSVSQYLQDAVVTMRGDRYCIPVKAEHRSKVPGIVHDQSSTGSTFFIEPAAIVELNNKLTQLHLDEQEEIGRILTSLTALVAQSADIITEDQKLITLLDFMFAKAKYALKLNATKPVYNEEGRIRLRSARHPLLDPEKAVPINITLGEEFTSLIITGPNTGGKTVSLKTAGLLTLMGQAGLHIPALDRSELSVFNDVYADIGDEQSIEQSLSTFSSHMTSIVQILKHVNSRSLCLFDELGAGTDPTEGAALATAILEHLHKKGIRTMATTHYNELKTYAITTPGVENACCEFNVETLSPTYRLLIGIPGKSNAFAISKKLGLSDAIIDAAGKHITTDQASLEDLISDLDSKRVRLEKEIADFEKQKKDFERREKELAEKEDRIINQKDRIINEAREEAKDILSDAKNVADETIRAFNNAGAPMKIQTMEKKRSSVREYISKHEEALYAEAMKNSKKNQEKKAADVVTISAKNAVPGTSVHVLSMDVDGTIVSAPDKNGNVSVQCGIITSKVKLSDLTELSDKKSPAKKTSAGSYSAAKVSTISPEINLIGRTVDDAISLLDKYIDDAMMSRLDKIRVVHGKGTGALRKGIHDYLRFHPGVKHFDLAAHGEGDGGVTIVEL
ncbi:MAG: endonuclease MutS2 [Lachnospiraceae bacterium]|nr:endonuclease MutS2 [Lachnospiraceae bacterium]